MKIFLLCLSITFFLRSADLPDDDLKLTGGEKYQLLNGSVVEIAKSIEINGRRHACLPTAVLGRYTFFPEQKRLPGHAIVIPIADENQYKAAYSAFQAKTLKEKGAIQDIDYKNFLKSFDLQNLYRCASGANVCGASDVLQDCLNILQEPHRIEELIKLYAQPESSLKSIVGSDGDVRRTIAYALVSRVIVPEVMKCFETSSRIFDISEAANIRLSALRAGSILASCEPEYFNGYVSYIFRPGEDPKPISAAFFTPNIDVLSVGMDTSGNCAIVSCNAETSEVKMAAYTVANTMGVRGYCISGVKPSFVTAIPKEYIITANGTKISVYDKRSKNKVFTTYDSGLLRPISVLESRNVGGENLLYVGSESGDFCIFRLDNLRKKKILLDGCESIAYTGIEDDKALLIRSIPHVQDSKKNRVLFVHKSGNLMCYDHEKKNKDFEHSVGKEITVLDLNPGDNTLIITGHTPFVIKLWQIGSKDMSLIWCNERRIMSFFKDPIQDVCWLGTRKIFVSFKNKNKIEELDLGDVCNALKDVNDNKNNLKKMLAFIIARDAIGNKNKISLDVPNIKKIMKLLPYAIKKKLGIAQ